MAETYFFIDSRLVTLKKQFQAKYWVRKCLAFLKRLLGIGFVVIGTGTITWCVYQNCVDSHLLEDGTYIFPMISCITTGSLFATFGSAIIAVFTLYTSKYMTGFQECLAILSQDLAGANSGRAIKHRYPFIPRVSRIRTSQKDQFYGAESAIIQFRAESFNQVTFLLPTTVTEFKDLPILLSYLRMKQLRSSYLSSLSSSGQISEYPAWDCVMAIYRNILFYKASYFCVWIGVCFVLQSILFAFFYSDLYLFFMTIP